MSTLNDVQNAIVDVIEPIIYPNGTDNASIANVNIYLFAGDSLKLDLDAILKAGEIVISVFATRGMTRNTTRLRREFTDPVLQSATLFLEIDENTVNVNGSVTAGQVCMIIVNGIGYAYSAQSGDTLNSIASALGALIPGATINNNTIKIDPFITLDVRVSVPGSSRKVLHSQESVMRVRIIAPSNELRDLIGNALQIGIAEHGYYLSMPDLISASIKPSGIQENNAFELDLAYMRDYLYLVEYHTVQVQEFQTIADAEATNQVSTLPIQ